MKITKADAELWKQSRVRRNYGSSEPIIRTKEELINRALKEAHEDSKVSVQKRIENLSVR